MLSLRASLCLALVGVAACGSSTATDGGVDGGTDGGTDGATLGDGDFTDHGSFTCPASAMTLVGTACPGLEGTTCGAACTDPCGPCDMASCMAGTWVAPSRPGPSCFDMGTTSDGGAQDAGTTFSCGGIACMRVTQYCDLSDVPDCLDLPASCGGVASCACLAGMGHTSCDDDGAGGVTTHSPGG